MNYRIADNSKKNKKFLLFLVPFDSFLTLRLLAPILLALSLHREPFLAGHI
jgi:hypothetical protein